MMISAVAKVRSLHDSRPDLTEIEFMQVLNGQQVRAFACIWFFLKFLCFATWYRCSSAGNIMERTANVFRCRNVVDLVLYFALIYTMYLEHYVDEEKCKPVTQVDDGSVTIKVFSTTDVTKDVNCDLDSIFGAKYLINSSNVMEFHATHIVLFAALVLKELYIYFQCVRRAASKLTKETVVAGSK